MALYVHEHVFDPGTIPLWPRTMELSILGQSNQRTTGGDKAMELYCSIVPANKPRNIENVADWVERMNGTLP